MRTKNQVQAEINRLKPIIERRFKTSRDEVLAKIRQEIQAGLSVDAAVNMAIDESYWRGAMDVSGLEVPHGSN